MEVTAKLSTAAEVRRIARRLLLAFSKEDQGSEFEVKLITEGAPVLSDEVVAILSLLRRTGRMRRDLLVHDAAESLYRKEIARGGAAVDLGLLGPRVFVAPIQSAIDAGRGQWWEVYPRAGQVDHC